MNFFKSLLASTLGFFIAIFLFFFVFIFIGGVAISSMNGDKEQTTANTVLELDLALPLKDYNPKSKNPIEQYIELEEGKIDLNSVIRAIERAKSDDRIKGISIKSTSINAGLAQTQSIRKKLEEFKASGKFVYSYNDFYTQKNYYLSSVADSTFINPVGGIEFEGLSGETLFFKSFQEKYGFKMEVIRSGKYKSAVEPFLEDKMSPANKEQMTSLLKSLWDEMVFNISKSRKISIEKINEIADNLLSRTSEKAKDLNLIDGVIYEDQYLQKLKLASNADEINLYKVQDYIMEDLSELESILATQKIAVIYAQGDIEYGEGNREVIGQGIINEAIDQAIEDEKVKAIVLRVNSPGGSGVASELIWRKLQLAKQKKPIVVSMGNYAASGGYYISCSANTIFAEPTTITGSIGVFGVMPNVHQFSSSIGINAEQVETNNSPKYSVFEPIGKRFYEVTQQGVKEFYSKFVTRVSNGRKMNFEKVHEIAQGRVWTGKQALDKGLVDKLGTLEDAIKHAAIISNSDNYVVQNFPDYKNNISDVLKKIPFLKISKDQVYKEILNDDIYNLYHKIDKMKTLRGIQARLPYQMEIN